MKAIFFGTLADFLQLLLLLSFEALCREQTETSQENTNPYEALGASCQNEKYNPKLHVEDF